MNIAQIPQIAGGVVAKAEHYFPEIFKKLTPDEITDMKNTAARLMDRGITSLRYFDSEPVVTEFRADWRTMKYMMIDRLDEEGKRDLGRVMDFMGDSIILILSAAPGLIAFYMTGGNADGR